MPNLFSVSPDPAVATLVERTGYAAAALTLLPIPGSEVIGVMPLHVGMVLGIGQHHDRTLTRESATELLLQIGTTVGLSLVGSRLATTAAKIVLPGLGGLVAAPFMFASTLGLGAVADAWFRSGGRLSEAEMRDIFTSAKGEAKRAYRADRARDDDAMNAAREAVDDTADDGDSPPASPTERLRRAKQLLDEGLIDEQEVRGHQGPDPLRTLTPCPAERPC